MRIVLINKYAKVTGGADTHVIGLARALTGAGHQVLLLSTRDPHNEWTVGAFIDRGVSSATRAELSGPKQVGVFLRSLWNRSASGAAACVLANFSPDVVHAHKLYPQLSVAVLLPFARAGVPIVQTLHDFEFISADVFDPAGGWWDGGETRLRYRLTNTALYQVRGGVHQRLVSGWIAVSRRHAARYAGGGIDAQVFPNFVSRDTHGEEAVAEGGRAGILFVGRLTPLKGIPDVIDVAERLSNVQVTIAGAGPMAATVTQAAMRLPNLTYLGPVQHQAIGGLLRRAGAAVIPSRWEEGGPLVALEAMAAGAPVIAYDVGGLGEYVRDAGGVVVAPDAGVLAGEAQRILTAPALAARIAKSQRARIEAVHRPAPYVERLVEFYRAAIRAGATH